MAKFSDIIKSFIDHETLSKNKWLVVWFLAGVSGTGYQQVRVNDMEDAGVKAVTATAAAFQVMLTPVVKMKPVKVLSNCKVKCKQLITQHEKRWH